MTTDSIQITFVRDLLEPHESRRALARSSETGTHRRLARGAYVASALHDTLTPREQYLLRVRAVAGTRRVPPVLSHWSAAALHDLPFRGRWPNTAHLTVGVTAGGRSQGNVVRHSAPLSDEEVVEVAGLLVTSIRRTAVDMAARLPFANAVMIVDRALLIDRFQRVPPMTSRDELMQCWEGMGQFRGFARAKEAIDFGEDRAESPLESVSRVTMRTLGCPRPSLQVPHYDAEGYIGDPDFYWPGQGAVGEADGAAKYLDENLRGGRTAEQVHLDEKNREDRLRALPRSFARWDWAVATDPAKLRDRLARIDVPMGLRAWR